MLESGVSHANAFLKQKNRLNSEERGDLLLNTSFQLDKNALAVSHRKHPSHWWGALKNIQNFKICKIPVRKPPNFKIFKKAKFLTLGLHNSESSKGQIDQHKLAAGRKSLFCHSVEEILKGQVIIRSRAFATFSATEFSRAARKDLAGRIWPTGRMLCRPDVKISFEV